MAALAKSVASYEKNRTLLATYARRGGLAAGTWRNLQTEVDALNNTMNEYRRYNEIVTGSEAFKNGAMLCAELTALLEKAPADL